MADVRIQQYPLKPVLDDNDYFLIADAEDVDVNGWLKYKKVKAEDLPTIVNTAEDITIAGIQAKIVANDLTLAKFYRITNSASGVSPLLVQAVSVNSVSYQAFDAANPLTTINYNVLTDTIRWSLDETTPPLTSVGLSMPPAFSVANSPLTANGTLAVTAAGIATQYVRGDGTLADFPTTGGGGSSVSFYLNGGTNQGVFGGNTYYELGDVANTGAAADFNINTNGYIAQFITDVGVPNVVNIPAGNWNIEFYFSASSAGGSPSFYVELYKYNGGTFTLLGSNAVNPEGITNGTTIDSYFTAVSVAQTSLLVTDRLAVRVFVNNSSRTITLHTQNGHLSQVISTLSKGMLSLNGESQQTQYLATGTAGNDFNILSATGIHTFNIPTASATKRGLLSTTDWTAFDSIVTNAVTLATTQTITGTKTFSNATTKFYSSAGISPSQTGGSPPTNWLTRLGTTNQNQVLDSGVNSSGAAWFQNYSSTVDNNYNVISLNPVGGDVVVNRITSAGYKFDVNGTCRIANNAYFGTTAGSAVGIGTVSIVNSAILEMVSTTKGLLPPRMTTGQVNAISAPANGLVAYNTTLNKLCIFENGTWKQVTTTVM